MRRAIDLRALAERSGRRAALSPAAPRSSSTPTSVARTSYVDGLENVPERYRAVAVPLGFRNLPAAAPPSKARGCHGPSERHDADQVHPGSAHHGGRQDQRRRHLAAAPRHGRRPHDDQPAGADGGRRLDHQAGRHRPASPVSPAPTRSATSWSTRSRSARPGSASMPVGSYELAGTGTGDGLLGRDFLDQFKMTVDAAKGEVHAGPEVARRVDCATMTLPGHGLQSHAEPAENRLSDEGQPRPGRAADARLVGRDRHLQAAARGPRPTVRCGSSTTARRTPTATSTWATSSTRSSRTSS